MSALAVLTRTEATPPGTDPVPTRTDALPTRTDAMPTRTEALPMWTEAVPSRTEPVLARTEPVIDLRFHRVTLPTWHPGAISAPSQDLSALFTRVQGGDREAFAQLYDAIAPAVFGAVKRVLRDQAMSEEVTQEVFVELWTSAARFDPSRGNVSTWAITIARRRAIDRVRSEQSQRNRIEQLGQRRPDASAATDDLVVASLDARQVSVALAELPEDQRHVIQLAFIDGFSHADIADHLGLPLGTVKGRVRGGLQKLSVKLGGLA